MSESKLLTPSQIEDLRLAASKMTGPVRRSFQAEILVQYCNGSARLAEKIFGWNRESVQTGLFEARTGMICFRRTVDLWRQYTLGRTVS